MKIIIAGSRNIPKVSGDKGKIFDIIEDGLIALGKSSLKDLQIISGGAKGVDTLAEQFAREMKIEFIKFEADWNKYGKKAGYIRNCQMAEYVGQEGGLIAIWDGQSKGTKMMIDIAKKKGIKVLVYETC